ncbi:uncharacterized protein At4g04775-like [Lotus japonicus]|uniref:uncharacterized protein At4g04775-like n=1 Tax=Lotus japonicus TaxID=34305 RepID=UPI002588058B|nr:uncharacterized protein At4g04775-like [Lotus japonicus]
MRRPALSSTSASRASGSHASDSRASPLQSLPPGGICECGELILYLTSHTSINPGRKFWRCRNFKTAKDCGFFLWDDNLDGQGQCDQRQQEVELLKTMLELEDLKRKHDELSRKFEESKKKNNKLQRKLDCETMKNNVAFFSVGFAVLLWVVGDLGLEKRLEI